MEFQTLLATSSITHLPEKEQLDVIGNLFDLSLDNNSIAGIKQGFKLSEQINVDSLSEENYTVFHYDISNGWNYLRKLQFQSTNNDWNFQIEELTKEIFHLRKALSSPGFHQVVKERQCQIYTNLGNSFSYIGRFVEAQEYWNKALDILPQFAMAIGNKANGLYFYGHSLFDEIHQGLFMVFTYHHLGSALSLSMYLDMNAKAGMQQLYDYLGSRVIEKFKNELPDLNDFDLGDDKELEGYRKWCLMHQLFINPLNDLGAYNIASHDCLNLPTVVIEFNRPPVYLNLFNQIKQEFGTARYTYYLSIQSNPPHFSDTDISLVDTMETIRYSYYVEQLKIAFRLSYSVLDKVAYLLNDYLKLGIDPNVISFRKLWYSNSKNSTLLTFFTASDNWALRGLYWLSKDLYDKDSYFISVLEPEAKEIATIRNFIEHKGFKIVSEFRMFPNMYDENIDISYTISRTDFKRKTLKLLKLTRAAIMYLSLAISHEENKKDYSNIQALPIVSGTVPHYMKT